MKVFCIGFSKTGTTSLETALEHLGFRVCRGHWNRYYYYYLLALYVHRDYDELFHLTQYWDAFADAPWGGTDLYREAHRRYPHARFILTVRDRDRWYASFERMITEFDPSPETAFESYHRHGYYGTSYFFTRLFGTAKLDRERILDCYDRHNREAIAFLSERGCDHLVMDLERGDGWQELCSFLGRELPDRDFPRENVGQGAPSGTSEAPSGDPARGAGFGRERLRHLSLAVLGPRLHGRLTSALRRRARSNSGCR